MRKRFLTFLLCIIAILNIACPLVGAEEFFYDNAWHVHDENIKLYFDGDYVETDVPSLITNDRTLVPVRAFFEMTGAKVSWNEKKQEVSVVGEKHEILLGIDSYVAYINDKSSVLDVPAKIVADSKNIGRTLVPVRFISEKLGYKVQWDQKTYSVYVSTPAETEYITAVSSSKLNGIDTIKISASSSSKPVITKISNPERLILDFYDFQLKSGDGSLNKEGISISNVRYANHDNYARIVIDIKCDYTYELKVSGTVCTVNIKGKGSTSISPTPTVSPKPTQTPKPAVTPSPTPEIDLSKVEPAGNGLVVIDPGHGGSDPGAIGYKDGEIYVTESFANLDISLRLYELLKSKGINVAMTRTTDVYVGLKERAEYANNLDASLFICVHNNSATTPTANGSMVYYYTGTTDPVTEKAYGITSKDLAQLVHEGIIEKGERYDRKIADGSKFVVLYSTNMPAVLTECAFISNDEECELLNSEDFRQKLAEGIADGVLKALKIIGKL